MFGCMKVGYGYKRREQDLRDVGAEKVFIDLDRDRAARADMLHIGLRRGDVLVVLYLRDLGGSPVADRVWRERVQALGVTIEIAKLEKRPACIGRPRKFNPNDDEARVVRAIWLDPVESERVRLRRVAEYIGRDVSRGILNGRYGWPTKPK
jgi:hypothetical protein